MKLLNYREEKNDTVRIPVASKLDAEKWEVRNGSISLRRGALRQVLVYER